MLIASCLLDPPDAVAALAGGSMAWSAPSGIFRVRPASEAWELQGYWKLRQQVFCREQQLFTGTDVDEHDAHATAIVAVSYAAVMDDDVVGTVRIYEQSPGVWFGSRLAVEQDWRGVRSLAAGLIRCAVCTAHARGCHTFLATVQRQNVPLFRRLHWRTLSEVDVCGRPHHLMQADLAHYPPAQNERYHTPVSEVLRRPGWVAPFADPVDPEASGSSRVRSDTGVDVASIASARSGVA